MSPSLTDTARRIVATVQAARGWPPEIEAAPFY